jgi:hypothetical protein
VLLRCRTLGRRTGEGSTLIIFDTNLGGQEKSAPAVYVLSSRQRDQLAVQEKTQLTAQFSAVDDLGQEHLVSEYTTEMREQMPDQDWTMWVTQGRTFLCEGNYLEKVSGTEFRVPETGVTLVAICAVLVPERSWLH